MANAQKKIEKNGYSLRLAKLKDGKDFEVQKSFDDALAQVVECANAKFVESVDISVKLGIDTRQSDQNVRGVVTLPHGTGKKVSVAVVARDAKADDAKKAGAAIVGAEELIDEIQKGVINFDRLIATPDMMPLLGKVAKVLGPKGLMPNPKLGTVTNDISSAVSDALAGQVQFRAEKNGIVHASVGKVNFDKDKLRENAVALLDALVKAKPSSSKGVYVRSINISSTMGPGFKVVVSSLLDLVSKVKS